MTHTIAADYDPMAMSDTTSPEEAAQTDDVTEQGVQFSVLRRNTEQPIGPLNAEKIFEMLRDGDLDRQDFVYYSEMPDWQPIEDVFEIQEQISHFVDDGQDKEAVADAFQEVNGVLAEGESIYYIAVQDRTGLLSKSKDTIILTERSVLVLRRKRPGFEIEALPWSTVTNTMMRDDGNGSGTFSILLKREKRVDIGHIPSNQVHRLFQLSQELNADTGDGN